MNEEQKTRLLLSVKLTAAALGADVSPDGDEKAQLMGGVLFLIARIGKTPEGCEAIGRAAGRFSATVNVEGTAS